MTTARGASQMECLRSVLTIAGEGIERCAPQRMETLVQRLREAFLLPDLSAQARKTLLEVIELRASGWQFNLAQELYHFPYTQASSTACESPTPPKCRP
ncbi:MIF4G domain-containing protein-like [Amblyomma americanum]|uniref:MIF4G domain-containing protein n=1 Tax=Amblyomma americanum TaxID=6943 RepID=A0AAQ4ECC3_AMBAM